MTKTTTTATETKTCQICGRAIKLRGTTIALHGYTRPGQGWQTGSCPGAQHLPFEVSCDLLRSHVEHVAQTIERQRAALLAPVATASLVVGHRYIGKHRVPTTVAVTEATLDELLVQHAGASQRNGAKWNEKLTWSMLVARARVAQQCDLDRSTVYHGEQSRRLAKWVAPA